MAIGFASAALLLGVVGTVRGAKAAKVEGEQAKAISEYNANLDDQNAELARRNAEAEVARIRKGAKKVKSQQRAAYAASGVEVGVGSSLLVLADTAREAELDIQTARERGEIEAAGYKASATASRFTGEQAYQAGKIGASSTILSGFGRAFQTGASIVNMGGSKK